MDFSHWNYNFGKNGKIHQHREAHLAYPGAEAMWWAISADDSANGVIGSSFAAPRVSRAAALVSEQFPWMSNDQVRHSLFTTTDRWELQAGTEKQKRIIVIQDTNRTVVTVGSLK